MALSTGLIRRLNCKSEDEPLAKRLKLAENVYYSPDLPIVCKEDCILRWLCNELSDNNASAIWITIHRCLSLEPKSFSRLSPETKNLLIEKLKAILNDCSENQVSEEILKCCVHIFSSTNIQSFTRESQILDLMKSLISFTNKIFDLQSGENKLIGNNMIIESTECAISAFAQVCRQNFLEKKNFMVLFVEELFFPLSLLVENLKSQNISSKIIMETQKCIRRLLLGPIKSITSLDKTNEKNEETEILFNTLNNKVSSSKQNETKAALNCLFQCVVNTFQQNPILIDIILRKLVESINQKEQSKQVLTSLLENSVDISYDFDHAINEISLKTFLLTHIEEIISKKKHLKYSDYELLIAITKLNPLIVEDITQRILKKILFENKICDKKEEAQENLIKELWRASVRLRRHHKFISKFLISLSTYEENEMEALKFITEFELPQKFVNEFTEDLKSRTTNSQILAMLHTFIYHLKSDCIGKMKSPDQTSQVCLSTKIISKLLVLFFEHSKFLDNSLPQDWQIKFYQAFTDLRNVLSLFTENICETSGSHNVIIYVSYSNIIKTWSEAYDLLRYYTSNTISNELDFPIDESQLKDFKRIVKKCKEYNCEESLNQILLYKSIIFDRNSPQSIKEKVIEYLWPKILENHFEIIEYFDEKQILKLTEYLVSEACTTEDNLTKWSLILERNVPKMSKLFATAVAFQIIAHIVQNMDECVTKNIIEKIDLENILKSLNDFDCLKKNLKSLKKATQDFKSLNLDTLDHTQIKRNLTFLSHLPLSFLDTHIRKFFFMILYTFEQESKGKINLKDIVMHLYSDLLRQNDVNVLSDVSNPLILINHFKDYDFILVKIFKLSLNNLTTLSILENFIDEKDCTRKISSILLTCVDNSKSKCSNEVKIVLQNLSKKLSDKIINELPEKVEDSEEISGLRISLKIFLSEKKELDEKLKKCIESILQNTVQNTESIPCDKLNHESLQLSLIVLLHRDKFDIDMNVVKKLCNILIVNPDKKIFLNFLEVLKDEEFNYFAKLLSDQTKENLVNGNIQILEKLVTIWEDLSKAVSKVSRSKILRSSVNNLFNDLLSSKIKEESSIFLLKICRALVTSKRMILLSNNMIDLIFVMSMESLNELNKDTKLITCQEALGLCLDFLRSRTEFLLDRLPILTNLFRKIVEIILQEGKSNDFSDEQILRILILDIEKFCTFFAKLKKYVARISPYLIADLLDISSHVGVLPSFLKASFNSSIFHLLSNCDQYAIRFLYRNLPDRTQQIFKTIFNDYSKYHKFTGKI